jgi:outer membrane protein TolC
VAVSEHALEAQRQDSILNAAQGYYELTRAQAVVGVINDAREISQDYQQQLQAGVAAGILFKGDELRVRSQTEHYQVDLRQALEQQRIAAASLARVLHLDPRIELVPRPGELVPLKMFQDTASVDSLVDRALRSRPELRESQAGLYAARAAKSGAVYGPWIPSVGAQVFGGGLGGGPDGGPNHFGAEGHYTVGISWRIGPGGLFDSGRINANKARVAAAELGLAKIKDSIAAEVVSNLARVQSLSAQIELTRTNVTTASEALRLSHERKQFGVGIVLEDIQTQRDLTQARSDYVRALADFNKAQYALARALGEL